MKRCAASQLPTHIVLGWIASACLVLQGCHAAKPDAVIASHDDQHGAVSYTLAPAAASQQLRLKRSEHAFGAEPLVHEAPSYPATLIPRNLPPQVVQVKAIIDDNGHVAEVRDTDMSNDPDHAIFVAACREALLRWTYSPMTVVQEFDDGRGNISQVRTNTAFSLDYVFHFALLDGHPAVTEEK